MFHRPAALFLVAFILWLACPADAAADTSAGATWVLPAGSTDVSVPARFLNGVIVLRLNVAGRGLDVALDTGFGFDMLDKSVFDSMAPAKSGDQSLVIADAQLGPAQVQGLSFESGSFYRHYDNGLSVVGVLGYDFLANEVVKIDYDHESVEIIPPSDFVVPPDAAQFPVTAGDKVPVVEAKIGDVTGSSFVIDTGATTVVAFPQLANVDPDVFSASHELKDDAQNIYYRSFWPLCGQIQQVPYSVPEVSMGSVGVRDWAVWKVGDNSCFQPKGLDGLIGYDFLRLFDVYIDYPDSRIVLEPNSVYKNAPNTVKQ